MDRTVRRVIPAWAGNTHAGVFSWTLNAGHPRVGGEHLSAVAQGRFRGGSSPRGRGTRYPKMQRSGTGRVIPAWAGNTSRRSRAGATCSGHPRVGGEHSIADGVVIHDFGSSPRGRGTRRDAHCHPQAGRVIPAWAGNTMIAHFSAQRPTGHPRVGGEHYLKFTHLHLLFGSSPRGRGTLSSQAVWIGFRRVIPAWAGNTRRQLHRPWRSTGHPRVGGEHTDKGVASISYAGSSPRGRGTPVDDTGQVGKQRVIPAWAGNTGLRATFPTAASGHPRVGGEHKGWLPLATTPRGSSPRGRGTHFDRDALALPHRVIPAWAGNTPFRCV